MYKVVTLFSMFVSAFAWSDVPDTASFSENDIFFTINCADVSNSQPLNEVANPDPGLVIDVCDKAHDDSKGLPKHDDFFTPHENPDNMPRYHVYPQVDNMPAVNIDFSVDTRIIKIHPEIGVGLLAPRYPEHVQKYLPYKK